MLFGAKWRTVLQVQSESFTHQLPPRIWIIDRTAFLYGYQGSTRRLHQLGHAWQELGHDVHLIRSALKFRANDGEAARELFPGTCHDIEPRRRVRLLETSRIAQVVARRVPFAARMSRKNWAVHGIDRPKRELMKCPSVFWGVCKGTLENAVLAASLSNATGHPWVLSLHDPPIGLLGDGLDDNVRHTFEHLLESAAHVCTTSATLRDVLVQKFNLSENAVTNIPLRVDTHALLKRWSSPELGRDDARLKDKSMVFRLSYAGQLHGNLSTERRSLIPIIDALVLLRVKRPSLDVEILLMGMGTGHDEAIAYARDRNVPHFITYLGSQTEVGVKYIEQEVDAYIILQGESQRHQLPSKVFEILASGKPILALAPEGSELDLLLRASGQALASRPNDEETIINNLATLLSGDWTPHEPSPDFFHLIDRYRLETLPAQLSAVLKVATVRTL
jgi:hypothetical protein